MRTTYDGPVATTTLEIAAHPITLIRPTEPERMLDDPGVAALNAGDDYMPYWAYLWPGSFLLADAVLRTPWPPGIEAIELGCGLGLGGLAALHAGLRVQFTDYDEAPLHFAAASAEANGFAPDRYRTRRLDWRHLPDDERFRLILASDVLYEPRLVPLVADTLARLLAPDGEALLAGPYRASAEAFPEAARARGLIVEAIPATSRDEDGRPVSGTLHRARRLAAGP